MRGRGIGGLIALGVAALVAGTALAGGDGTEWAFPGAGPAAPSAKTGAGAHGLPGSALTFTDAQLVDRFRAVDWWPDRHRPAPSIVNQGRGPHAMACGFCHLPSGEGRPENASLAGLPADYIARQVADMRSGARGVAHPGWGPAVFMQEVAGAVSPAEAASAGAYFAKARFVSHVRVVERARIPAVTPQGFVYRRLPGSARVALGQRIVEGPDDFARFELRDSTVSYTAYVPPGAIRRGQALATTGGGGRTQPCGACHGSRLEGAVGPPLAGRSPSYVFRQLNAFKTGTRSGADAAPMKLVAARLTTGDMIDLAAFVAASKP